MATVRFKLRENRAHPHPTIVVYLRQGAERSLVATPFKVAASVWNAKRARIKNTLDAPDRDRINSYLDELESAANAFLLSEALEKRPRPPLADIRAAVMDWMGRGVSVDVSSDLLAFAKDLCERLAGGEVSRAAKPVTPATLTAYKQTLAKLTAFCEATRRGSALDSINGEFYRAFVTHLNGEGFRLNSVGKHVKTLKTFLAEADASGYTVCQDFRKGLFKGLREAAPAIALTLSELLDIARVDLGTQSDGHHRARDLFVIAAFTGLRFSDVTALTAANFQSGYAVVVNKKTGTRTSAPVLPEVEAVLLRYNGSPPPALSNQKANAYLKDVAKLAGIAGHEFSGRTVGGKRESVQSERWELVTTHTARRSFVTLMETLNVDAEHVKRATGHSTAASYQLYNKTSAIESGRKIREALAAKILEDDAPAHTSKVVPLNKVG